MYKQHNEKHAHLFIISCFLNKHPIITLVHFLYTIARNTYKIALITSNWQAGITAALTLLVGRQEEHPACKNWAVGCWHGYLSGARCRLAYGPADAIATHCQLASVKSGLVLPFWYRLTWVVPDKGPLNGSVCVWQAGIKCTVLAPERQWLNQ